MTEQELNNLIDRYLAGHCTEKEARLLDDFFHSYVKNANKAQRKPMEDVGLKHELLQGIGKGISEKEEEKFKKNRTPQFLKIAASFSVVIGLGLAAYWFYQKPIATLPTQQIVKATQRGQKYTLVLSDGTLVRLNAESSLTYPQPFAKDSREVVLIGEAFFEVTKNKAKPFIIKSGNLTTTVVGTSFNVKAFPKEEMKVTVVTGQVNVASSQNKKSTLNSKVTLVPNEQATFDEATGRIEKKKVDVHTSIAWKEGIIQFDQVELQEAATLLERWYGVTITFENEDSKHCKIASGKYQDESLINILKSFEYILNIEYEVVNGNQITLKGKGCKPN
jgi:transmembrane sensor